MSEIKSFLTKSFCTRELQFCRGTKVTAPEGSEVFSKRKLFTQGYCAQFQQLPKAT